MKNYRLSNLKECKGLVARWGQCTLPSKGDDNGLRSKRAHPQSFGDRSSMAPQGLQLGTILAMLMTLSY
ncbi:hypothetical protein CEXT_166631 [Caerostris extrusa]|uniref:Uncharacterized protein n=1 Tax=Caerostris extrusa TaxID=172846 RepID=A0AAV4STI9_CAEEX|nr:hypothetical protein CEXT_166631 [Caerostris extrusa]